jgi:flagellar protein FliS
MLSQNPYGASAYRAIGIETGVAAADPLGLVVMLYDGAIQAIARAESHLAQGEIAARGQYTSKAIDIVTQGLSASLDRKVGGALAESLGALYDYMGRRLFTANLRNDPAIYAEVRTLLLDLRTSWITLRASTPAAHAFDRAAIADTTRAGTAASHALGRSMTV